MRLRRLSGRPTAVSPGARRVVIGVDFDEPSLATARWVASEVAPTAELVLVHVLPVPRAPDFLRGHLSSPATFVTQVAPAMHGGLQGFASTLGVDRVRVEVRVGEPAEQLAELAAEVAADLVCVGYARPRRGGARSGRNTVERLLRRLRLPLLVGAPSAGPLARVVAAVDGGGGSAGILGAAWAIADRLGARLDALHVLDTDVRAYARAMSVATGSASGAADGAADAERELRAAADAWLREELELAGASAGQSGTRVCQGDPGPELLGVCAEAAVDLLVVGREGRDALAPGLVGSTTRLVLRAASTPVMIVPQVAPPAAPTDPDPGERRSYSLWPIRARQMAEEARELVDAGPGPGEGGWLPPAARWRGRAFLPLLSPSLRERPA